MLDRADLNRPSVVNAAAFLTSLCLVPAMLLPYVAGAVARELAFDTQQIGLLSAALIGGIIIVMASSVFWIRAFNWRVVVAVGSLIAVAGFLVAGQMRAFVPMCALVAIASFGVGIAYAPAICMLGDTADPDRNFGRAFFMQIVLGGLAGFISTELGEQWGLRGIMGLLSALYLLALLVIPLLPSTGARRATTQAITVTPRVARIYGGLIGMLLLTVGPTAVWVFFEGIGSAAGFSARSIGNVIAAGLLLGAPGALLSAAAGIRFGRMIPLSIATITMVVTFAIAIVTRSLPVYALCAFAFQFMWNFSLSFQYGAVSQADESGRLIVLAPVFQGVGAMLAPAIAGTLIHDNSYWSAVGLAAVTSAVGLLLMAWLCMALARPSWPSEVNHLPAES
jgi:hypothetical protein